jgi:hypothetical protein
VLLFSLVTVVICLLMTQRKWRPPGPEPDPDQLVGRFGPSDNKPQLAGSKCVHCEQKILISVEAVPCKHCQRPVHLECRKEHRRAAHVKPSPSVYR